MRPDRIGNYRIESKIGSGGMADVYLGRHEETNQEAAIKVLSASMARESGFVERFSREVGVLHKLKHPNIVRFFEQGKSEDGSYFFAMEYVDGETLTQMVTRRKRIPWREVIEISLQIAAALKAAHYGGIIHRDLKPSNLMMAKSGDIKLADFGVAAVFDSTRLTKTGGVIGTAEYMSPEQAKGKRADKQSDLYSLGAVMYVMLTGRPPFTGKLSSDIQHKHLYAQFDKPSRYADVPRLLEDFVCQLLEKKPEDRFPDAAVAIAQLEKVLKRIDYAAAQKAEEAGVSPSDNTQVGGALQTQMGQVDADAINDVDQSGDAFMKNAIRDGMERRHHQSLVSRFFDNTYVLLTMLGLVIATGVYLWFQNQETPEQRFEEVAKVMDKEPGRRWLDAERTLRDLRDERVLEEHFPQIDEWLTDIEQYDFCRRLSSTATPDKSVETEVRRLIQQAFELRSAGDTQKAISVLNAVLRIETSGGYRRRFLVQTIDDWRKSRGDSGRDELLKRFAATIRKLIDSGAIAEAQESVTEMKSVYADDAVLQKLQQTIDLRTKAGKQP